MLEEFRNSFRGTTGKVIITVLVCSFAFFGASSIVTLDFGGRAPVKVNGEGISAQQIESRLNIERQNILQRMGQNADPSLIDEALLRSQVIDRLVQETLLAQSAEEANFVFSDLEMDRLLFNETAFRAADGSFDSARFAMVAAQQGLTARQFRSRISEGQALNQWVTGIDISEFVLPHEVAQYAQVSNQTRDIEYRIFRINDLIEEVVVDDEAVVQFYDENSQEFQTPERVAVEYVRYPVERIEAEIAITDQQIQEAYDAFMALQSDGAEKQIAHILITTDSRSVDEARALASDVAARAQSGDFAALAAEFSEDPGSADFGGDLGVFMPGIFDPEFEAVVEMLSTVGEISAPVRTEFGFHIIQLVDLNQQDVATLSDMAPQLRRELVEREVTRRIADVQEELANVVFTSLDLSDAAATFDLTVERTELFSRNGTASGITAEQTFIDAAFSGLVLNDEMNSDVIQLADNSLVALRKVDYQGPDVEPLENVRTDIVEYLRFLAAVEAAESEASALRDRLVNGNSVDVVLEQASEVPRFGSDLPANLTQAAFRAVMGDDAERRVFLTRLERGDWAVGRVTDVQDGELRAEERDDVAEFVEGAIAGSVLDNVVNDLRTSASVRIR